MKPPLLRTLFLLAILNPLSLQAQTPDDPQAAAMTKMRQVLRDTIGQLRDAQNQVVTLQAAQAQSDKEKADLQARIDALTAQLKSITDQAAADKADLTKQVADLQKQSDDQTKQIGLLTQGVKQWKDAQAQTAQLAAISQAALKQYQMQAALLQRTVDDRETKNLALYKLGNEILTRYEKFGLGEALEAKEPFVGLSRVKLENLVQDYKNKLLDQAVVSGQTAAPMSPVPAEGAAKGPPPASSSPAPGAPPARPAMPVTSAAPRKRPGPGRRICRGRLRKTQSKSRSYGAVTQS